MLVLVSNVRADPGREANWQVLMDTVFELKPSCLPNLECLPSHYQRTDYRAFDADLESDSWPKEILDLLRKHQVWQSTSSIVVPGFMSTLGFSRKWQVDFQTSTPSLKELTKLSLVKDCKTGKFTSWESGIIELSTIVYSPLFHVGLFDQCASLPTPSVYTFRFIGNDRIEIRPKQAKVGVSIILFPEIKTSALVNKISNRDFSLFTGPGGPSSKPMEKILGIPFDKTNYLHHNLTMKMEVAVDSSFPSEYLSAFQESLNFWNHAVGQSIFQLVSYPQTIDLADCVSARKLCIFWDGGKEISWIGMGGYAAPNFDPQTGEIIGGFIQFSNSAEKKLTSTPPSVLLDQYLAGKIDFNLVTSIYSDRESYTHYLHPKPMRELAHFFSHELGHFNGLSHNFKGSNAAVPPETSKSVMDYMPFSASGEDSGELQEYDLKMAKLIYTGVEPSTEYSYCGDDMVGLDGPSPDPNCNIWDFGSSEKWFMELARKGKEGVFTPHPKFVKPIVNFLGGFLEVDKPGVTTEQQREVKNYLCSQIQVLTKIQTFLKENHQVVLSCP